MTLDKITSLADLEFKVKANPYYRQMVWLGARRLGSSNASRMRMLNASADTMYADETYDKILKYIHETSLNYDAQSCSFVVRELNYCRGYIDEFRYPLPPTVETAPTPSVDAAIKNKKADSIVAELKKKANRNTKKKIGKSSGSKSKRTTQTTAALTFRRRMSLRNRD